MKRRRRIRLQRALRHMTPGHIVKSRMTRGTIEKFADRIGLVFFGYVDQKDDDHRLVRGHTVSSTHIDKNYCVGSVRGYDVSLVSRNDIVISRDMKLEVRCHWLIATIDLKTTISVPHLYIGHNNRRDIFASSFERLMPLSPHILETYPRSFLSNYVIYGLPTHGEAITRLINGQIAEVIASHFKQTSIEIEDNCVYLYIESEHPSESVLEKILSNGLWLATAIDHNLAK